MEQNRYTDLDVSYRILLGPGPSMASPRVLRAMSTPLVGHLDPDFLQVLEDEQNLLRFLFQTENELTLAIQGTGMAGMEAALSNIIEEGDDILVGVMGFFGERISEVAARYGANVDRLERPWGQVFDPDEFVSKIKEKRYKFVALVHAETSTGALQTGIAEIAAAAHQYGALLIMDTVTSLGGMPVEIDAWGVDVAFSGSQKSLSCPPGLAPITVSPRALNVLQDRKTPVGNWYFDLLGLLKYWQAPSTYHHTAPISLHYALREGLRIVYEEGLRPRFERHRANAEMLWAGLEDLDLPLLISREHRLTTLATPQLSPAIDDAYVRQQLLNQYNIEIAGGFGQLAGKVWRIGLMGFSSRQENVVLLLAALEQILRKA